MGYAPDPLVRCLYYTPFGRADLDERVHDLLPHDEGCVRVRARHPGRDEVDLAPGEVADGGGQQSETVAEEEGAVRGCGGRRCESEAQEASASEDHVRQVQGDKVLHMCGPLEMRSSANIKNHHLLTRSVSKKVECLSTMPALRAWSKKEGTSIAPRSRMKLVAPLLRMRTRSGRMRPRSSSSTRTEV